MHIITFKGRVPKKNWKVLMALAIKRRTAEIRTALLKCLLLCWLEIPQGWPAAHKTEHKSVMMLKECPAVRHKGFAR